MLFNIDVKKLVRGGTMLNYPSIEFTGKTVQVILEEIIGQSIAIIIDQGMEGSIVICGNNEIETIFKEKGRKVMSAWAVLSLWQDSPIIGIVWPPIPTIISEEKASKPAESGFEVPDFVAERLKEPAKLKSVPMPTAKPAAEPSLFDEPPVSAEALFREGYKELSDGHLDAALEKFKMAVTIKPEFERAWSAFGYALEEATREDDAIVAYRQAVKLDDHQWKSMFALGRILVRKRQLKEGIERLESALSLSKKNRDVVAALAQAYAQVGEVDRAARLMAA